MMDSYLNAMSSDTHGNIDGDRKMIDAYNLDNKRFANDKTAFLDIDKDSKLYIQENKKKCPKIRFYVDTEFYALDNTIRVLNTLDLREYKTLEVVFTATTAGTLTFEHSIDGLSWKKGSSYSLLADSTFKTKESITLGYIRMVYDGVDNSMGIITCHTYARNY